MPNPNPNGDGKTWGQIKCVPAALIPSRTGGKWHDLFREVWLRLDKTGRSEALVVPFDSDKEGNAARTALGKMARSSGVDIELVSRKRGDGGRDLYVRRGISFKKSDFTPEGDDD